MLASDSAREICPNCGSEQLNWRVKRRANMSGLESGRELLWECRRCGERWVEQISGSD